jgi:large subunit ribosomal protein L31
MKKEIHPEVIEITARCVCGTTFPSISTQSKIDVDICSMCHPFFTGQQKFVDTAGRIEKFQKRFAKNSK